MFPRLHPDYGMERPRIIAPLSSHRTPRAAAPIYGPDDDRPMLVVDSPRLLEVVSPPGGLGALRDHLARSALSAAGTDVDRTPRR